MIWLIVLSFILQPLSAIGQVVADPGAGTRRPQVETTSNGREIVQVTTPNASGVSHNRYTQFNVGPGGLILNNSQANAQTQLGGWVASNPFLVNGPARLILNEVTSANRSHLNGFMEIAGQRADLVVANPNGITCSGCGFINASRGVLTTGVPVISPAGSLDGFRVTRGDIAVEGGGLIDTAADRVDLIARSLRVNSEIWAKNLSVVTGSNSVDYTGPGIKVIEGEGDRPAVAIDVAALGGMYADRIMLIGTERGVGVNSAGTLAAMNGDLTVTIEGMVMLTGDTSASANIAMKAAGGIANTGTLYSRQNASFESSGSLLNTGTLTAGGNMTLRGASISSTGVLGSGIDQNGRLKDAGDMVIDVSGDAVLKNQTAAAGDLRVNAAAIDIADSSTRAGGNASLTAAGGIDNTGGMVLSGGDMSVIAAGIDNTDGTIFSSGNLTVGLLSSSLANTNGGIGAGGNLDLTAGAVSGPGGRIVSDGDMAITAQSVTGIDEILSGRDLTVSLSGDFTNESGKSLKANRNLTLTASGPIANYGLMSAVETATLDGSSLANDGTIEGGNVDLNIGTGITNSGTIAGYGAVNINTGNLTNYGSVFAGTLSISAQDILNQGPSAILGATDTINLYPVNSLTNKDEATIYSLGDINIAGSSRRDVPGNYLDAAGTLYNESSVIEADNDLTIFARDITNRRKVFTTGQVQIGEPTHHHVDLRRPGEATIYNYLSYEETITETRVLEDSAPGMILSGRNMNIRVETLTNRVSTIAAGANLFFEVTAKDNKDVGASRVTTRDGTHVVYIDDMDFEEWRITPYNEVTYEALPGWPSVISANLAIKGTAATINNETVNPSGSVTGSFSSTLPPGSGASAGGAAPGSSTTGLNDITLPSSGLYHIYTDPGRKYLVETDPRFTSYASFLSSDYMLSRMSCDPHYVMKRLGDGFYEQKLVENQVLQLTGRRFLSNFTNNEDQFRALMENAVDYAEEFKVAVGVSLSAGQMAALTSDMVWLEERIVEGQKVLVPVVYLASAATGDVPAGAVIAAKHVELTVSGNITNSGTIRGDAVTSLEASTILNRGGTVDSGGLTSLRASGDILNQSGKISGETTVLSAGRDIQNVTLAESRTNGPRNTTLIHDTARIVSRGDLAMEAGRDVVMRGGSISSAGDTAVTAGRDIRSETVQHDQGLNTVFYSESTTRHVTSSIGAGGNLAMSAGSDASFTGTKMEAGGDLTLQAGGDVKMAAVKDSDYRGVSGDRFVQKEDHEKVIGSEVTAGGNALIAATKETDGPRADGKGNVEIVGSTVTSKSGMVGIVADNDINIREESERHESLLEQEKESGGSLSSTTTKTRDYSLKVLARGSTVSGEDVVIDSGRDLAVRGSNVVGTKDVSLAAKDNIDITTARETFVEEHMVSEETSGLMGAGVGITWGSVSNKSTIEDKGTNHLGSTVGSVTGWVDIYSGKDTKITGSDILSAAGTSISGENITIDAAYNTREYRETTESSSSGLTLSLSNPILDAVMNTYDAAKTSLDRASGASDSRLAALSTLKAAKEIYKGASKLAGIASNPTAAASIGITLKYGESRSESETAIESRQAKGSSISSAGDVFVEARGRKDAGGNAKAGTGDLNVIGSAIEGTNVSLKANNDIKLLSAEDTSKLTSSSESISGDVGVSFSVGANTGFSISANIAMSEGSAEGFTLTNKNTHIRARDVLAIDSGRDTTLMGAVVSGDTVKANIGRNLSIVSRQDIDTYTSESSSMQAGITIPVFGFGAPSGYFNYTEDSTDSNYRSVTEQSGIHAGTGGFDITVGGNTDLKGSVMASGTSSNRLSTNTLTYSNIENTADYDSSSRGISAGFGSGSVSMAPRVGVSQTGSSSTMTLAAIAPGTIEIRSNPGQDIGSLSRDTKNAHETLGKIFDQKTVEEQRETARLFGELAFEAVGDIGKAMTKPYEDAKLKESAARTYLDLKGRDGLTGSEQEFLAACEKEGFTETRAREDIAQALAAQNEYQDRYDLWKDTGAMKAALHAFTGGLQASLGGGDVLSGALGAGAAEISRNLTENLPKDLQQWASVVVGAAAGSIASGNTSGAMTGAATALDGERYNRRLHETERQVLDRLKKKWKELGYASEEQAEERLSLASCALVHCADGISETDLGYRILKVNQNIGNTEEYSEERKLLLSQKDDFGSPLFVYAASDRINDAVNKETPVGNAILVAGIAGGLVETGASLSWNGFKAGLRALLRSAGVGKAETVTTAVTKGFNVNSGKFDYFFGRVTQGSEHNIARSAQNLRDLTTLGIKSENQLINTLNEAFNGGNIIRTTTSNYGVTVTKSVNVGNVGKIDVGFFYAGGNMNVAPSVTTIIPIIYK